MSPGFCQKNVHIFLSKNFSTEQSHLSGRARARCGGWSRRGRVGRVDRFALARVTRARDARGVRDARARAIRGARSTHAHATHVGTRTRTGDGAKIGAKAGRMARWSHRGPLVVPAARQRPCRAILVPGRTRPGRGATAGPPENRQAKTGRKPPFVTETRQNRGRKKSVCLEIVENKGLMALARELLKVLATAALRVGSGPV